MFRGRPTFHHEKFVITDANTGGRTEALRRRISMPEKSLQCRASRLRITASKCVAREDRLPTRRAVCLEGLNQKENIDEKAAVVPVRARFGRLRPPFAGVGYSGKEIKQVAPPPCPEWYADREFNVSLWGARYVFTGNNWIDDRYIEADHAWGGGIDLKYFFMRYSWRGH